MRYKIGQKIVVIAFDFEKQLSGYQFPFMHSDEPIRNILLKELTVTEQHEVAWDQDPEGKKEYTGYLLTDSDGKVWSNQYPTASYGQMDTSADVMFRRYSEDPNTFRSEDFRLYRDVESVYDKITEGISVLSHSDDERDNVKAGLLAGTRMTINYMVAERFKKKFVAKPIYEKYPEIIHWVLEDIKDGA